MLETMRHRKKVAPAHISNLPGGHLRVHRVDAMLPGIGDAGRHRNHFHPLEALPVDFCRVKRISSASQPASQPSL